MKTENIRLEKEVTLLEMREILEEKGCVGIIRMLPQEDGAFEVEFNSTPEVDEEIEAKADLKRKYGDED